MEKQELIIGWVITGGIAIIGWIIAIVQSHKNQKLQTCLEFYLASETIYGIVEL